MPDDFKQKALEWDEKIQKQIEKKPERRTEFATVSELPVKRAYWPWDVENFDMETELGLPGSYPFTRGVQPNMYRGRLWTMRQYAGFGSAEETNKRFKYLIEQGQTGLSIAFDLPTQIGYDSDHELAAGEVGKVGVAIDSIDDMRVLFDGIDLVAVSTSMTINSPAAVLLAMYIAVAEEQGGDVSKLRGTIQKRYPQGISGSRHIHISAGAVHENNYRHLRLLQREPPSMEYNQYQRIPYTRSRLHRSPGSGVHLGQRDRLCAGRHRCRPGR